MPDSLPVPSIARQRAKHPAAAAAQRSCAGRPQSQPGEAIPVDRVRRRPPVLRRTLRSPDHSSAPAGDMLSPVRQRRYRIGDRDAAPSRSVPQSTGDGCRRARRPDPGHDVLALSGVFRRSRRAGWLRTRLRRTTIGSPPGALRASGGGEQEHEPGGTFQSRTACSRAAPGARPAQRAPLPGSARCRPHGDLALPAGGTRARRHGSLPARRPRRLPLRRAGRHAGDPSGPGAGRCGGAACGAGGLRG